jgi:hypothetical protein
MTRDNEWLNERITRRQYLSEVAYMRGASWPVAIEAAATTLLAHPELDGNEMRLRREWHGWGIDDDHRE